MQKIFLLAKNVRVHAKRPIIKYYVIYIFFSDTRSHEKWRLQKIDIASDHIYYIYVYNLGDPSFAAAFFTHTHTTTPVPLCLASIYRLHRPLYFPRYARHTPVILKDILPFAALFPTTVLVLFGILYILYGSSLFAFYAD